MCRVGFAVAAGFVIAAGVFAKADAIQTGREATVSGGLGLSQEIRPYPRPPIIVNAAPPGERANTEPQPQPETKVARENCPDGIAKAPRCLPESTKKAPARTRPAS